MKKIGQAKCKWCGYKTTTGAIDEHSRNCKKNPKNFTAQPKSEIWKQALADHTCHHKFEDMNTSEMEVAEFVAGTVSGSEAVKDESIEALLQDYLIKLRASSASIDPKRDRERSLGFKAGYAANQTKNNK